MMKAGGSLARNIGTFTKMHDVQVAPNGDADGSGSCSDHHREGKQPGCDPHQVALSSALATSLGRKGVYAGLA